MLYNLTNSDTIHFHIDSRAKPLIGMRNNINGVVQATCPDYFNYERPPITQRSPGRRSIGKTELSEQKRTTKKKMPRVETPNDPRLPKFGDAHQKVKPKQQMFCQPSFGMIPPQVCSPKQRFRTEADQYFIVTQQNAPTMPPITPSKKGLPPKHPQVFNPEHVSPRQTQADTKIKLPQIADIQPQPNIKQIQAKIHKKQTINFIPQVFPQNKSSKQNPVEQKNNNHHQPFAIPNPFQQTVMQFVAIQKEYQQQTNYTVQMPPQIIPFANTAKIQIEEKAPKEFIEQKEFILQKQIVPQREPIQQFIKSKQPIIEKPQQVRQTVPRIQQKPKPIIEEDLRQQPPRTNYIMNSKSAHDYRDKIPEEMVSSSGSRYELKLLSCMSSERRSSGSISINSRISTIKQRKGKKMAKDKVQEVVEKVEIHLDIIGCFAENADWIDQYYLGDVEWNLVKFYSYNRYYVQRQRAYNSLCKASESCFVMKDLEVTKADLKQVYKTPEVKQLCTSMLNQNIKIRTVLQQYFNNLEEKPYPRITLTKLNSRQIIEESDRQLQGLLTLLENKRISSQQRMIYERRIIDIIKMVFLIEELDGDFVKSYTDSIDVTDFNKYIRENKWLYDRVLDNRC